MAMARLTPYLGWSCCLARALMPFFVCYRKSTVSTFSKAYQGVTDGSVAQPKCQKTLFSSDLRCLEYASSNQVVGGSNPSGRTNYKKVFRQPGLSGRKYAVRTADRQRDRFDNPAMRRVGRRR